MKNVERQLFNKNINKNNNPNVEDSSGIDKLNNNQIQSLIKYSNINNNLYHEQNQNNYLFYNRKNISNTNDNNTNNNIDPRIEMVCKYLNIEKIIPLLNNIIFNDLLMFSRKDLLDLGLQILERNRILHFSEQFLKYAKNYSIEEINSFFKNNKNLYNKISISPYQSPINNDDKKFYYSNGFDTNKIYNKKIDKNKEKDSEQEVDYCNIMQGGRMSRARTNASSKNNYSSNKIDFFTKYQELTQEVDNYINKFKEYKQSWFDSKNKYNNLMNSYMIRGKSTRYNKSKNKNNMKIKKAKIDNDSYNKLKLLEERKKELKKKLGNITDKSNHKKMIIKYLEENE